MPRGLQARVFAADYLGPYRQTELLIDRRLEAAALIASDEASRRGLLTIRQQVAAAGLGRLGNALGQTSDMQRGRVHRTAEGGFSASGVIHFRSRSPRTRGAIEAYAEGAQIRPRRGRWLWIATEEAGRLIGSAKGSGRGRTRLTPEAYRQHGEKLGPLIPLKSIDGRPLLAVENVGKSATGQKPRVRSLTKKGAPRKNDRLKQLSVLFVAIPSTSRAARINVQTVMRQVQAHMPSLLEQALARTVN